MRATLDFAGRRCAEVQASLTALREWRHLDPLRIQPGQCTVNDLRIKTQPLANVTLPRTKADPTPSAQGRLDRAIEQKQNELALLDGLCAETAPDHGCREIEPPHIAMWRCTCVNCHNRAYLHARRLAFMPKNPVRSHFLANFAGCLNAVYSVRRLCFEQVVLWLCCSPEPWARVRQSPL